MITQNLMPDGTYAEVDKGSSATSYTCTSGSITSAQALRVTDDTTMRTSIYEFQINLGRSINYNVATGSGMLRLTFPSDIRLPSSGISCVTCPSQISSVTRTSSSTIDVLIANGNSILASNNPLVLKISGIQNPRSQKPTREINIVSFDS